MEQYMGITRQLRQNAGRRIQRLLEKIQISQVSNFSIFFFMFLFVNVSTVELGSCGASATGLHCEDFC
jgi:hypothetical protein